MRNRPLVQMLAIGGIAVVIFIPVALVIPWFPANASTQAGDVRTLYDVLLIVSVPVAVLVLTVVMYSVWKFRMRPGEENKDGPPIHGNTRLEVLWTAVPAILIVGLCTYAYTVLRSNEDSKPNTLTVNVTERQFAFEFSYPQADGKQVVSSQLYLPKGRQIVFKLRSLDVIHSFFVPEFSVKLDAVPGITTTLRATPTRLGAYPAECTELCGAGHALMRAQVFVLTPEAFQTWLQSQQPLNAPPPIGTPPPNAAQPGVPGAGAPAPSTSTTATGPSSTTAPLSPSAAAGKAVFTGSAGCSTCHTLAAAGATATIGPDLGTKVVPNAKTRGLPVKQFIEESIVKPNAFISPGFQPNIMPQNFSQSLTPAQIQQLVDFIASVTK